MYYEEQVNEKLKQEMAARERELAAKCAQGAGGHGSALAGGYASTGGPCRVGIRERVDNDLHRANGEARKADALQELAFLLEKNPEVAQILDLIEMVRG